MDNPNTADRNVTPTCRYGHGDLSKVERTPESHFWGLIGANTRHFRTGTPVGQPLSQTELSGRIYTLQLFRCSICGYLEFFDDNIVDMRDRLTALETRFDSVLPTLATKADIEDLRTGIHKVDATIKTWMLGTVLTIIGTMLAAIFGVAQIFKNSSTPTVQTSAPSPVIIQVPTPPLSSK